LYNIDSNYSNYTLQDSFKHNNTCSSYWLPDDFQASFIIIKILLQHLDLYCFCQQLAPDAGLLEWSELSLKSFLYFTRLTNSCRGRGSKWWKGGSYS